MVDTNRQVNPVVARNGAAGWRGRDIGDFQSAEIGPDSSTAKMLMAL
jgi:hypothetical protein